MRSKCTENCLKSLKNVIPNTKNKTTFFLFMKGVRITLNNSVCFSENNIQGFSDKKDKLRGNKFPGEKQLKICHVI